MGRSRVGLLLRALADRPMIEAENRHCTIPRTAKSAGFGNQTHKCALGIGTSLADDAQAWEVALSVPVGAGLGDTQTGRGRCGTCSASEAPFIEGEGTNPPPNGLARFRFCGSLTVSFAQPSVSFPSYARNSAMSSSSWFTDRLDYSSDIYAGPEAADRLAAWNRLTPTQQGDVILDFHRNGPWWMRKYAQQNSLPFDRLDIVPFLMGVFSDWGKYNIVHLRPSGVYRHSEDAAQHNQDRLTIQKTTQVFSNPTSLLFFTHYGATSRFKTVMHMMRPIGSLSPRHLTMAKWYYLNDLSGLYYRLSDSYQEYATMVGQGYSTVLHSDEKARLDFQLIASHGSTMERQFLEVCKKIEFVYVPSFDESWADLVNHMQDTARYNDPIAVYARQLLGGGSSAPSSSPPSGWATSR